MVTLVETEESKQDLAETVFKNIISDKKLGEEILSKVKWSVSFQSRQEENKSIPKSKERSEEMLSGNLRGFVAEVVSEQVPINEAETVYSLNSVNLNSLKSVTPQEFARSKSNKKGDVLASMFTKSLKEKPLRVFDPDIRDPENPIFEQIKEEREKRKIPKVSQNEYTQQIASAMRKKQKDIETEFIQGQAWGPSKGSPAGESFQSTTIPDALLTDYKNNLEGFIEVKAYTTDELAALLNKINESGKSAVSYIGVASDFGKTYPGAEQETYALGVDLAKETEFVDIVRGLASQGPCKRTTNVVLLRFPNDIPDNLLKQYGEKIADYGYQNIVIQKLPFSTLELDVIAKEIIKKHWSSLLLQISKDQNFSDKELGVLREYAESKF